MKTLRISKYLFAALLVCGCSWFAPPQFAREVNGKRIQIGLPTIPDEWVNGNTRNNRTEAAWGPRSSDETAPRHGGKKVLYASGQWELEQDYYFSGKTFPSHDPDAGTVPEELIVSYAFIPFPGYDKGWTCYYDGPTNVLHKISLEDAEKILQSWGIKRLDD